MQYVISDIHGCYDEFIELLKKIDFNDNDTLYVLGDVVDRGPEPMKILMFMASFPNIIPIVGNHEYLMLKILPDLMQEIEEDNIEKILTADFLDDYQVWAENGGKSTIDTFKKLSKDDQEFIIDYVNDFSLFEETVANGRKYLLIHSLPNTFHLNPDLNYVPEEILFERPDFEADWNFSTNYIIGHTPTLKVPGATPGKVFKKGCLTDIDCGCSAGLNLAAYCLETGEAVYITSKKE